MNVTLIGTKEFRELLGVSWATFWVWRKAGYLPRPCQARRPLRWPLDEVEAWVRAGMPKADVWAERKRLAARHGRLPSP